MGAKTKIEWAAHSFSPWIGCSRVHAGCANCYAEAMAGRLGVIWGPNGTRRRTAESTWRQVEKWNRKADCNCGASGIGDHRECDFCRGGCQRPRVFPSLCDPFEDWKGDILCQKTGEPLSINANGHIWPAGWPSMSDGDDWGIREYTMDDVRHDFFALIDRCQNLDFLLSTKRPENVRRMWPDVGPYPVVQQDVQSLMACGEYDPEPVYFRRNCWLLYSASDQQTLEAGLPHLLACRDLVPVLGLILEPLVGPVDLHRAVLNAPCGYYCDERVGHVDHRWPDWVIVGGESGPRARPCQVEWIRSIVQQCREASVPVFVKQMGANVIDRNSTMACSFPDSMCWPEGFRQDGQRIILRDPKGGDPSEWPEGLRVRQYPKGATS